MWWRDQVGWWCLPSASILKLASSSLCWAPARMMKRRRSRKVRPSISPVSKRHCSLSPEDRKCEVLEPKSVITTICLSEYFYSTVWTVQIGNIGTFYRLVLIWLVSRCHSLTLSAGGVHLVWAVTAELFEGSKSNCLTLTSINLNRKGYQVINEITAQLKQLSEIFFFCLLFALRNFFLPFLRVFTSLKKCQTIVPSRNFIVKSNKLTNKYSFWRHSKNATSWQHQLPSLPKFIPVVVQWFYLFFSKSKILAS